MVPDPLTPIEAFLPATIDYAKRKAKHLRSHYPHLTLGRAQQLTAKAMGHADWHALEEAVKQSLPPSALNNNSSVQPAYDRITAQMCVLCDALKATDKDSGDFAVLKFLEAWQLTGPFPSDPKDPFLQLFGVSVFNRYLEIDGRQRMAQEDTAALSDPAARVSRKRLEQAVRKHFIQSRRGERVIPVLGQAIRHLLHEQVQLPWNRARPSAQPDGKDWPNLASISFEEFFRREAEESGRTQADMLEAVLDKNSDFWLGAQAVARELVGEQASDGVTRRVGELAAECARSFFREACVHDYSQKTLYELLYNAELVSEFNEPQPYEPEWDWDALRNGADPADEYEDFYEREYESVNEEVDTEDTPYLNEVDRSDGTSIFARVAPGRKGMFRSVEYELLIREPGGRYVGVLCAREYMPLEPDLGAFNPDKEDFIFATDLVSDNSWQMIEDVVQEHGEEMLDELIHFTHITYLEVSPSWRKQGFGTALLDSLFAMGDRGWVCVDIHPQGFPYVHLDKVSKEIRDKHNEGVESLIHYFRKRAKACPSGRWDDFLLARNVLRFASRPNGKLRHTG
jgi:ribosomal protein S18 acetylase RimI-like enzyme